MTREEVLRQRRQMRRRIMDVITERRLLQLQRAAELTVDHEVGGPGNRFPAG